MNLYEYVTAALRGTPEVRERHAASLRGYRGIISGIHELEQRSSPVRTDEAPIFLFSAGWRAGSTLLQRFIMSDPNVFIWGEPFDECGIIQRLADTIKAFRPGWPPADYFLSARPPDGLHRKWIANLFPAIEDLRVGHRAFFDSVLAQPAYRAGATRWGLKEVRLSSEHAFYLRWLYPDARFVFLHRNPLHAYESYNRYGRSWYATWPDKPVFSPLAFGRHWRTLLQGYIDHADELDALSLAYESMVADASVIPALERHLGISIDPSILEKKVGTSDRLGQKAWVSHLERWLLRRAVSPLAQQLGYEI